MGIQQLLCSPGKDLLMRSSRLKSLYSLCLVSVLAALAPAARADTGDSVVLQWNAALLQAIRDTHPGPPMCARELAVVNTCTYAAWAAYDPIAVAPYLGGTLRQPAAARTLANKSQAISFAAYRALVDLFPQPAEVAMFGAMMRQLGYDPAETSTDPITPAGVGNMAAMVVLDARHHDGSNQLGDMHPGAYSDYTGYQSVNTADRILDPTRWQPLRVSDGKGGTVVQKYIGPQWGLVTPFALTSGSQFRPGPPAPRWSMEFVLQAQQLIDISAHLTDRQKMIAEYWADGPSSELPPGHWCLFAEYVSHRDHYTVDQDARMMFALANAVFDASIAAWDAKRAYDSVRPVTLIHALYKGHMIRAWAGPKLGTRWIRGEDWQPYQAPTVVTPPFPEYVSGHSSFSAAAAEILKRFTGSDFFGDSVTLPAGSSKFEAGKVPAQPVTLSWPTFTDAANEAGISRRYGGIHFELGDIVARRMGRKVGAAVWEKALTYFNGTAAF
jgi:hypothetical protein